MKKIDCLTLGQLCEVMLDGEPVFIIRAQDAAAVRTLLKYAEFSHEIGGMNILRTEQIIEKFKNWRETHQAKVRPAN